MAQDPAASPGAGTAGARPNFNLEGFLDDHATAQAGVADASSPLPHGGAIQKSFGRHDVGGVKAAVGGPATDASTALGADAYATGDRVAFAGAPDLHLAAHEAAHVVQQRGGVQLSGGTGKTGDVYEQHADRVADLVVQGESAETALDEHAGAGAAVSSAVQRHDSPGHIAIGESVDGKGVELHGIEFSSGELAALTDYVGNFTTVAAFERKFDAGKTAMMKDLLEKGIEDVILWDEATNGVYSTEAQANEKHFAPAAGGDEGQNFRDQFIDLYSRALEGAKPRMDRDGDLESSRLLLYSAEHYLQDAFSAGHHLAAKDVATEVDEVLNWIGESNTITADVANGVFAKVGSTITENWGVRLHALPPTLPVSQSIFLNLASVGGLMKGNDGVSDAVRRFVHERLADSHVLVTSEAHPEPFELLGDHSLDSDGPAGTSVQALQLALFEARDMFENHPGEVDYKAEATKLFERHCPMPTAKGQQSIRDAIEAGTADKDAIIAAMIETMCETIFEVMDFTVLTTEGAKGVAYMRVMRRTEVVGTPHDKPPIDKFVPECPVTTDPPGESYIPEQEPGESHI